MNFYHSFYYDCEAISVAGVEVKFKNMHYPVIIAASHVKELKIVEQTESGLRVGSSVTLTTLDQSLKQAVQQLKGNVGPYGYQRQIKLTYLLS